MEFGDLMGEEGRERFPLFFLLFSLLSSSLRHILGGSDRKGYLLQASVIQ